VTWTRIADHFNERDDLLECSRSARLLYVELLVYGNRNENDGRILLKRLPRFTDSGDIDADLNELVANGLATVEGGLVVVDWAEQEKAEEVQKRRTYRAQVQQNYRKRRDAHARGDHSLCDPKHCGKSSSVTDNASSNPTGHETPSRSGPSRQGQGQEQGAAGGSADAAPQPLSVVEMHAYVPDDGSGLSCEKCDLSPEHPSHSIADERRTA
jgi:hypothetical protein